VKKSNETLLVGIDISEQNRSNIDWEYRQAHAAVPFEVVDGLPYNPCEATGKSGQGGLWHWGEALCADALVTITDELGRRWLLMVMDEREDGHSWALPGGRVNEGEDPVRAALRELSEETGLEVGVDQVCRVDAPRYVPDPRATDEAWMVTVPVHIDLGRYAQFDFPTMPGVSDARCAAWIPAATHVHLGVKAHQIYGSQIYVPQRKLLRDVLG